MLFAEQEIEALSLFAMCRDTPLRCADIISAETLEWLLLYRYIRYSRNGVSIRVTPEGHKILAHVGLDFPSDGQYRCSGSVLERRLNTAEWMFWLKSNGVNNFLQKPLLATKISFLPSFMLRREKGRNLLGSSRFIGILYAESTAFTCYYATEDNDGIYPDAEQRTFSSEFLTLRKKPKVLITGKTDYKELMLAAKGSKSTSSLAEVYFDAVQKFKCEVCFIPMNDLGWRQFKILEVPDYKKQILDAILPNDYELCRTTLCDAVQKSTGKMYLISIDGNLPRIVQRGNEEIHAVMLSDQAKTAGRILKGSKVIIHPVDTDILEELLNIPKAEPISQRPFKTKEGEFLYAPIITNCKSRR